MMKHMTINTLPEEERPREKLMRYGAENLSTAELVGIIIRTGSPDATAVELGQRLLKAFDNNLAAFFNMTAEELDRHPDLKGIGPAKACQIKAAIELGRRVARTQRENAKITSPSDAAALMMDEMAYLEQEHFKVMLLDNKNKVIKSETIAIGTVNEAIVHPREVFNRAVKLRATSIILAHNHPSGETHPSSEDKAITQRLCEAGEILGIPVLDHLIIGGQNYVSFKEMGLI